MCDSFYVSINFYVIDFIFLSNAYYLIILVRSDYLFLKLFNLYFRKYLF